MRNMFYSITLLQYSSLILQNCFVWIKWPITVAHGTLQASYEAGLKCLLTVSIISLFLIFLSTWPMVWVKRHLLHIYLSIYLYLAYKQLVTPTLIVMLQMRQPAGEEKPTARRELISCSFHLLQERCLRFHMNRRVLFFGHVWISNASFMEDEITDQWDIRFLDIRLYTMPGMRILVVNTQDCIVEEIIIINFWAVEID